MTVIEFFDNNSIENIISVLICEPEKVILVGDNGKKLEKAKGNYAAIAADRNIKVEFDHKTINRNNLISIVDALNTIVDENGACTFDLAGGEDLYLVAVGIVYQLNRDKVQLHRYNIRNGEMSDCDADGNVIKTHPVHISVEENIRIYGGKVLFEEEKPKTTFRWSLDEEFVRDVMDMWEICQADNRLWNTQINVLDEYLNENNDQSLSLFIDKEAAKEKLKHKKVKAVFISGLFKALERKKLISGLYIDQDTLSFEFKNDQIKRCLTKAGQLLEIYVTIMASRCREDGKPVYNDILSGVTIDWDGVLKKESPNVENEIDVMMMKGFVPVFISCKNGDMKTEELYKLDTVAERFGGEYAKKVLIAPELDNMAEKGKSILARAAELGINVIDNIDSVSEEKLIKRLSSLWRN